jgi:hypothetical protein
MSFLAAIPALLTGGGAAAGAGAAGGLGTALQVISLGTGIIGSFAQAAGQKKEARAAEQAARFDAAAKEQQAATERDAAAVEASDFRRRQGRILAERRANAGASGITSAGSPLLVEEATLREIALGSARAGHQGFVRSSRLEDGATLDRQRGRNARRAGNIAAGSTLLSGFGNFAGGLAEAWG